VRPFEFLSLGFMVGLGAGFAAANFIKTLLFKTYFVKTSLLFLNMIKRSSLYCVTMDMEIKIKRIKLIYLKIMAKAQIQPLFDRVLVTLAKREKETKGGILLPETEKMDKGTKGTVVAVGTGRVTESGSIVPMTVKKGDTVIFSKYGAEEVKIDGVEYVLLREDQLLAIIQE
jgi:chaperonin GroES